MHTTVDLAMQEVAEKAVNDAGIEYDDERIMLAEKAIERCVEALGILGQSRQQKVEQAALVAARRWVVELLLLLIRYLFDCGIFLHSTLVPSVRLVTCKLVLARV